MGDDRIRNDKDLLVPLQEATNEELGLLVACLQNAMSCGLSDDCRDAIRIATELRQLGGNSMVNVFRRQGVDYEKIVRHVASILGVDLPKGVDVSRAEWHIIWSRAQIIAKQSSKQDLEHLYVSFGGSPRRPACDFWNSIDQYSHSPEDSCLLTRIVAARVLTELLPKKKRALIPIC